MIYYYELSEGSGKIDANSDLEAIAILTHQHHDLLCIYKENDTKDGTPFIIIYEIAHVIATSEIMHVITTNEITHGRASNPEPSHKPSHEQTELGHD